MVLWADRFVHENKSISFYQPSPMGMFSDFVHGGRRETKLEEAHAHWNGLATGAPTPVPSPSSGGAIDILGNSWAQQDGPRGG